MGSDIPLGLDVPGGEQDPVISNHARDVGNTKELTSWKRVFRYAYSLVGNEAEAEDITQETFLELFRAQASGESVQWIGAWMRTVAKRLVYRNYRETRPDLYTSLVTTLKDGRSLTLELQDMRPSPEQHVIDQSMVRLSAKVLSEFSDRERECILMYFRGYNFAQIASVLGVSRWTARRLTLEMVERVRARLLPERNR